MTSSSWSSASSALPAAGAAAATGGATGMVWGSAAISTSVPALDVSPHGRQEPRGERAVECPVVPGHAQVGHGANRDGVGPAFVGHHHRSLDHGLEIEDRHL